MRMELNTDEAGICFGPFLERMLRDALQIVQYLNSPHSIRFRSYYTFHYDIEIPDADGEGEGRVSLFPSLRKQVDDLTVEYIHNRSSARERLLLKDSLNLDVKGYCARILRLAGPDTIKCLNGQRLRVLSSSSSLDEEEEEREQQQASSLSLDECEQAAFQWLVELGAMQNPLWEDFCKHHGAVNAVERLAPQWCQVKENIEYLRKNAALASEVLNPDGVYEALFIERPVEQRPENDNFVQVVDFHVAPSSSTNPKKTSNSSGALKGARMMRCRTGHGSP
jgi:hypothetical protein